jgi:outer membrane protein TolC
MTALQKTDGNIIEDKGQADNERAGIGSLLDKGERVRIIVTMLHIARSPALPALLLLLAAISLPVVAGGEEVVTLTLSAALQTALANNLDLANAALETARSEKERAITARKQLPDVSFSAGYTRLEEPAAAEPPIPGFTLPDSESGVAATAKMPLYTGGRLKSAREMASRGVDLTREGERRAKSDLLLETATVFYELRVSRRLVEIAGEALESSRRHLDDVEALLAQGLTARVDLFRSELNAAQRERDLADAEALHFLKAEHLSSLLFPDRIVRVKAEWQPAEPEELPSVEEWMAVAEERSPEIISTRLSLDLARAGVAAARAERMPSVGLFGAYGARDEYFTVDSEDRYWNAGMSLSLPLYRGGRTLLEIDRSRDAAAQASNSMVSTRRLIRRRVVEARTGTALAKRQRATALKAVTAGEENLRVTTLKYRQGLVANIDVIDALLSLSRAQLDRVRALRDYHVAHARLMRLAGTIEDLL